MSDYGPDPDDGFEAIARTDRYIDALASGARMSSVDPLSSLLGEWRDDVRRRPDAPVVSLAQAAAALGHAEPQHYSRFAITVLGGVAAAVLALGGFGAVVYDAKPGDALYGLHAMLFGESAATRDDAVTLAAQTELAQVRQLVSEGQWEQAQDRLVALSTTVQSVDDVQSRQQLAEQYNALTVQVIERNPQAVPPPPGAPLPVLPFSPLTLLPLPVVETTAPTTTPVTVLLTPLPTPSGPLPTPTGPLPTPTGPLPTPTGPLPTPTGPLPTPTGPLPTPTGPLPTPTGPLPTPIAPRPTPAAPLPTPAAPLPTPAAPLPTPAKPPPALNSPAIPLPSPAAPPVDPPSRAPATTPGPAAPTVTLTSVPQGPPGR